MKQITKRVMSVALTLIMLLSILPTTVLAKQTSRETQTCKFQILYVDDSFYIGYNYGNSWDVKYTCQYTEGHSGYNHSMACSVIQEQVNVAKTKVDDGYDIVGWAKTANQNPKVLTTYTGTTATQTTYTIYLVAKKPAPKLVTYTLTYDANDGTGALSEDSKTVSADSYAFTVKNDKPTNGDKHFMGWADSNTATNAEHHGDDTITLYKANPAKTIYAVWGGHTDTNKDGFCDNGNECLHKKDNGYCTEENCTHSGDCTCGGMRPSAPALSVNIMCIDSIDKPSFIGDTFTVTAKASDSDAVINMNCNQTFVEQTGSQKNEDGSVTFTYKVIKAKPAWANMTFTATATKDGATSDPVSKSQAINLRVRLMVKVKESDGTVIDNAAVVLDYAYSNEPHNRDLTLNYDNEKKIYQPKPWDLSASGDYASVIITLPDGRMATISKDEDGNSVQSLIAAGESDVVVEYQFPAYQVTGKLFVNGKPAKYTSGASTNQYTKTISGVYNTVISYDEMTDWAENLVKTDLDAENAPTKVEAKVYKDGGTYAPETKYGEANKLHNYVMVDVTTYYDVTFDAGDHGTLADGETDTATYVFGSDFPDDPVLNAEKHFEFDGWYDGDTKVETFPATVTKSVTYTAHWKQVSTDPGVVTPKVAAYKVEHYKENLDGSYTLAETDFPLYGEIGETVTAVAKTYNHYTEDTDNVNAVPSGEVVMPRPGGDGTPVILTLKLYYKLDTFTVTYKYVDENGVESVPAEAPKNEYTYSVGQQVPVAVAPKDVTVVGGVWKFQGWTVDGVGVSGKVAMVEGGLEIVGTWKYESAVEPTEKVTITFKVVNGTWADGSTTDKTVEIDKGAVLNSDQIPTGMKANSGYKTGAWSADLTGKQDQDATYTYKFEKESSSSSSSGSSSRTSKKYTLKYDTNDGKKISSESKSKKWTKDFEDLPVPTKKGYEFAGWYYNEKLTKKVKTDVDVDATTVILYAKWVEASELPFTDVDVNDSYYEAVKYCYDNNIFKGTTDTTFAPYSTLTRGQMVTVLWRLNGSPEPEHANPFTDVAATSPFAKAIAWAAENKLTNGVTETTFVPNQAISRQQFLTILYRYAVAMQYDVTVKNADEVLADYPDAENVSAYAVPAMQWAISTGVAGAVDGMLAPTDPAPRYQVAEFLANFCQEVVSR